MLELKLSENLVYCENLKTGTWVIKKFNENGNLQSEEFSDGVIIHYTLKKNKLVTKKMSLA